MDWLGKAALTATLVALLLALVRLHGERVAGLVTGLPTITAPALAWLALARGPVFAAEAAAGCIAAGLPCALFALGYALASRRRGPSFALMAATLLAAAPLALLLHWRSAADVLVLVSLAACAAGTLALRGRVQAARGASRLRCALRQVGLTACVSGAVSGGVGAFASELGAFASGLLAGAPLVAAAIVVRLHLDTGGFAVAPFVRGYLGGLIARTCFAALFALLMIGLHLSAT